jgi:hypothetical protein
MTPSSHALHFRYAVSPGCSCYPINYDLSNIGGEIRVILPTSQP